MGRRLLFEVLRVGVSVIAVPGESWRRGCTVGVGEEVLIHLLLEFRLLPWFFGESGGIREDAVREDSVVAILRSIDRLIDRAACLVCCLDYQYWREGV